MEIRVTARGATRLLARHPWVYRSDLVAAPERAGIYPVWGPRGLLALALFNPQSEIAVRAFHFGPAADPLATLLANLDQAIKRRSAARQAQPHGAFRLVHGEGDFLPGLVIDAYGPYAVLQANAAAWEPLLPQVAQRLLDAGLEGVLARHDARSRRLEGLPEEGGVLAGSLPPSVWVEEGEIRYRVDLLEGQKTGAYIDQRDNRLRLASFTGQRALDVFSYHGSFALHLAGFAEVTAVDSSQPALERAQENAKASGRTLNTVQANAFEFLREQERQKQRYDLIVLDPPALAKQRRDLERARAAYKELNLRAFKLLAPGGILATASCSHHLAEPDFYQMLSQAAADAHRSVCLLERRSQGWDHPVLLNVPETHYLKLALLEILG